MALKGAFAAATEKVVARSEGAHRINPNVTVEGDNVVIRLPLDEIEKAKPSAVKMVKDPKTGEEKESGGTLGFMITPGSFAYEGKQFSLNPGWCSFRAVKS